VDQENKNGEERWMKNTNIKLIGSLMLLIPTIMLGCHFINFTLIGLLYFIGGLQ